MERPTHAGLRHLALNVLDLEAMKRFYTDLLGFQIEWEPDRDRSAVPRRWISMVKEAIRSVAPRFSARRMVKEYAEKMYAPALSRKVEVER